MPRGESCHRRVALNALSHGKYTGRLFRSHLLRAREDAGLYDWMHRQICDNLRAVGKAQWARAEELARWAWLLPKGPAGGFAVRRKAFHRQFRVVLAEDSDVPGRVWNKAAICREINR